MANNNPTAPLRLFVAIAIPEPVRDEIFRVQRDLQPLLPRDAVRWTRPDQFHLTLRFLGNVAADKIEELKKTVGATCHNARPLFLRAEGVGFFPNPRAPRVMWVGIDDGAGRLADLQKEIETSLRPFTVEPSEKKFTGHVMLARLRNPRPSDVQNLAGRAQSLEKQLFGEWTAQEIEIIRSELSPAGARHTLLAAFPLGAL